MSVQCFISPPQDLEPEKVCEWLPLAGWIASDLPFQEIHLITERTRERIASLYPMDVSRLPPEMACRFIRRFKSKLTVREMVGERDLGTIIAKVCYDADRYDLVRIEMPRYRYRREKAEKRARIAGVLACPFCREGVSPVPEGMACPACGRDYPSTGNSLDFLPEELKREFSIVPTENVSDHPIGGAFLRAVLANPDRLFLNVGAGLQTSQHPNLINLEITDYPSTDVVAVGERLPFRSESLDGIMSECVLEHVKDPFACAREIMRVLKPGGYLHCSVPFLQPVHAYPNHFYNMTRQGLANLFQGMEIRKEFVPLNLHPMHSLSWILKAYYLWLPEKEKQDLGRMTVRELLETFPMGENMPDHPFWKALPEEKRADIAAGNTLIAVKPGAPCELKDAFGD